VLSRVGDGRWAIGIGCWLMAVAAVVFALRLALPSDGLRTLDPSGGATNGQLLLDSPHHSVDGIHVGDRLLAINGWPVTDILESPHQRPAHASDVLTYTVEHDASASDVRVVLRAHPDLFAWFGASLPGLVVNLGILLAAAWLVRRRPDEFAGHALLVFAAAWASSSLLPQAEPLDVWARPWLRFLSILGEGAYVASGLATLLFALAFPRPVGWLRRRPWIAVAAAPLVGAVWFATAMTIGHNDGSIRCGSPRDHRRSQVGARIAADRPRRVRPARRDRRGGGATGRAECAEVRPARPEPTAGAFG